MSRYNWYSIGLFSSDKIVVEISKPYIRGALINAQGRKKYQKRKWGIYQVQKSIYQSGYLYFRTSNNHVIYKSGHRSITLFINLGIHRQVIYKSVHRSNKVFINHGIDKSRYLQIKASIACPPPSGYAPVVRLTRVYLYHTSPSCAQKYLLL